MTILNTKFAIIIYLISVGTAFVLTSFFNEKKTNDRFVNIDGLRGFLALGVYIHHTTIWYQYIQTDIWDKPKSNLYTQFGNAGVMFFFMITSFLFVTKLINHKESNFDWQKFFIARFFRLFPMYFVFVIIIFSTVFFITNWNLNVSYSNLSISIFKWLTFTTLGASEINNYEFTNLIPAEVNWSLPYEWFFYFSLPIISLFLLKKKPAFIYIFFSSLFVMGFIIGKFDNAHLLLVFIGGAIAPFIIKYSKSKLNYNNLVFTIMVLFAFFTLTYFDTSKSLIYKIILTFIFTLIALGNNIFGLLKSNLFKFLGDISYSTYLLHGIILFIIFKLVIGTENSKNLTETEYISIIFLITPIVIILSYLGYRFIEKPFIVYARKIKPIKFKFLL